MFLFLLNLIHIGLIYFWQLKYCLGEQSASVSASNDDSEIVCENGVCFKRPQQTSETSSTQNDTENQQLSNEVKLARAKELIEKKRKEKDEEDARVSVSYKYFLTYGIKR